MDPGEAGGTEGVFLNQHCLRIDRVTTTSDLDSLKIKQRQQAVRSLMRSVQYSGWEWREIKRYGKGRN